ncbi:DNA polymerase/3'-5' exonuclease PolX [Alkaliphilus serpentinus]|uniref:DNA polymerase beta n=1 Tax=Alkaliphilus serpentinus TaxID=1482731 RepID=A0A833M945_9FIRM|nr:DNA polymerase/3'-5' exonuclease PolX [Alkaliphilus serpentinus]KAB3529046.1 DNA polymerase/3'-5' exonuclease PolX [Alkaliphilus serpentinus]
MDKNEISRIFEEIGVLMELKGENPFKVRAYYNGARIIELMEEDLHQLVEENRLHEIEGIGKALEEKIIELVKTGELEFYRRLKEEFPEGLLELLKIQGLGPKKVRVLYDKLNITSVEELERACLEDKLSNLKGFGEKTTKKILEGIENYKNFSGQYLISTGLAYGNEMVKVLKTNPLIKRVSLAGSIRRHKETIKDIDIIASCDEDNRLAVMDFFTSLEGIKDVKEKGITKSSLRLPMGINVDLRLVGDGEYPNALQHFTGSKEHNTALRQRAKEMGYKVNEYGIFKGDNPQPVKTEEDLYKLLQLDYIPPEIRENNGEIEAAEKGNLPNLIKTSDIKGVMHIHSNYSDGHNTIEELVQKGISLGFKYIGISDHSRSAIYAGGLKEEDIKRQHEEIGILQEKYKDIVILKGIESDILADGSLDYSDEVLESFDYIIGSIHSNFSMDINTMTKRLIKAINNRYLTILGHATGRLLLSRPSYTLDIEAVIEACGKNQVAIEINSNPHRLELDWRMCRFAKERGVFIAIEPDAHRVEGIDDIQYGVGVARKGWLEEANVLNSWETDKVLEFLRKRKSNI